MKENDIENIINELLISEDFISDTRTRRAHSEQLGEHFKKLYDERGGDGLNDTAKNVADCSKNWFFDFCSSLNLYDNTNINLCHNRFCPNCQKWLQATRLYKFLPLIEKAQEGSDLYHLVLSVPNCNGIELKDVIEIMFEAYTKLNEYFKLKEKIKGIDFSFLGYTASVRSLEITYKKAEYHPHLHCILKLKKGLNFVKHEINKFSFSYGTMTRRFSEFEIIIQKLWFWLINNIICRNTKRFHALQFEHKFFNNRISGREAYAAGLITLKESGSYGKKKAKATRITKKDIDNIKLGYSCVIERIEEKEYYEVFKYACKINDENKHFMSFDNFVALYYALKNKKVFQSYGEWYNVIKDDNIDTSMSELYEAFKIYLNKFDVEKKSMTIDDVYELSKDKANIISRRNIHKFLETLKENGGDINKLKIDGVEFERIRQVLIHEKKAHKEARRKLNDSFNPHADGLSKRYRKEKQADNDSLEKSGLPF